MAALGTVAALAVAGCVAFLAASARHTQSLSFPLDDGYIYSNYVLAASTGHPFEYNVGEVSGGITGLGWLLLCTVAYWLLAPLRALLGGLAPEQVQAADPFLAQQAGHLYLAAYIPGIVCLAFTAIGVYRLAQLTLPRSERNPLARDFACVLLGLVAGSDISLIWGAVSGLEVPLSNALSVWTVALLIAEVRKGELRWSLLLAALLPWARPDLVAMSGAALLWLVLRAIFDKGKEGRGLGLRNAALYLVAIVAGLALMSSVYYLGWGRPFPSSFYAKVRSLRLGEAMLLGPRQLLLGGRDLPVIGALVAMVGGLLQWLFPPRSGDRAARNAASWNALLVLLVTVVYALAMMMTLGWFGQEERYLMPLHPFAIVLLGLLAWRLLDLFPLDRVLRRPFIQPVALTLAAVALVGTDYVWATRQYVVEVRNIRDAHVIPALWIRDNTPLDSLVASEPIGAVKLFSDRRTLDVVGLTTPDTLGTYRDWPRAWPLLEAARADYLVYYPAWFDYGQPPAWASEVQRFAILDNRIAGSDVIAVYRLDWSLFVATP